MTLASIAHRAGMALGGLCAAGLIFIILSCFYNVYLHPLRRIPGPWLWRASYIPWTIHSFKGDLVQSHITKFHEQYGRVVRIAPNRVVFADSAAWRDLYVHKSSTGVQNQRDPSKFLPPPPGVPKTLLTADDQAHARYRSFLAPAFSLNAVAEQRSIVEGYVNDLIKGLKECAKNGDDVQDMSAWTNWTSFDIMGQLCFGESFNCLVDKKYHPWTYFIIQHATMGVFVAHLYATFPWVRRLLPFLSTNQGVQERLQHRNFTMEMIKSRMDRGETKHSDFITLALRNRGKQPPLTLLELVPNMMTLIIAGSETTASALSGALYLLCSNSEEYTRLTAEIRGAFKSDLDIDIAHLNRLEQLTAVLKETMRLYPPVPADWHRQISDPTGQMVAGYWVAQGVSLVFNRKERLFADPICKTNCGIAHYAAYRYKPAFRDADSFIPARWLNDPKYANDELDMVQPFTSGPRSCLGQSLAYMEMRLILAKLLFHFDFSLLEPDRDWIADQHVFSIWHKHEVPLKMKVTPVSR